MTAKLKVIDTYLRAIAKLARLVPEVAALEEEVASREAVVLAKVLELARPILPTIAGPITLREPWLESGQRGAPRTLKERGVVLDRTFSHSQTGGAHVHRALHVVVNERGKLVLVDETARWVEPAKTDVRWEIEASEVEVTPGLAAEHLRGILAGLLDVLRERLGRDLDGKRELKERLERLEDAERALR